MPTSSTPSPAAERIALLRSYGWAPAVIAAHLRVSWRTIYSWQAGTHRPRQRDLDALFSLPLAPPVLPSEGSMGEVVRGA